VLLKFTALTFLAVSVITSQFQYHAENSVLLTQLNTQLVSRRLISSLRLRV